MARDGGDTRLHTGGPHAFSEREQGYVLLVPQNGAAPASYCRVHKAWCDMDAHFYSNKHLNNARTAPYAWEATWPPPPEYTVFGLAQEA